MSYEEPFGHEVGEGWIPIVQATHEKLKYLDPAYRIDQIKEKFGGLRYYFTPSVGTEHIAFQIMCDVVNEAEGRCSLLCEECGNRGELRGGGWVKTLCDTHEEERTSRYAKMRAEDPL